MSRDCFKVLLFILSVGTTVHNLGTLLEGAGEKTCVINHFLETGNWNHCAVVGFKSENKLESAFCTEPIFGGIRLSWAKLDLVWCEKYEKFRHSALECDASDALVSASPEKNFKRNASNKYHLQLAKLYRKKSVPIYHSAAFGGKTWVQVVSFAGFSGGLCFSSGSSSGILFSGASNLNSNSLLASANNFSLNAHLATLKCFLELLIDQVSGILKKLSGMELVPMATPFSVPFLVIPISLVLKLDVNMALNDMMLASVSPLSAVDDVIHNFGSSFSKVLTSKVGGLKSKMVAFEVSIGLVLEKLNHLCSGMNNPVKQEDIVCWHKYMDNVISVVTKTKLKDKVHPWIMNKFNGSGYLDADVAIIMNASLAKHMYKVFKMFSRLISVKLLFKNNLSVIVLGLYVSATLVKRLKHSQVVNSMVVEALNGSTFVVLSGDFNENDFGHSTSFKKCLDLGLLNSLHDFSLHKLFTWSNLRGVQKCIDFILVSNDLRSSSFNQRVYCLVEFFDSDHLVVSMDISLGGLLNSQLNLICKQAAKEKWKYKVNNINSEVWKKFRNTSLAAASKTASDFEYYKTKGDINRMWTQLCWMMCSAVEATLMKTWYRDSKLVKTAVSSRFHKLKLLAAENSQIQAAIDKHIEAFVDNKGQMIRSVLEKPFRKVMLDHLVDNKDLVLKPDLVKGRMDSIIEDWIRKCAIKSSVSFCWQEQFFSFNYVNDSAFSDVIKQIDFDEFLLVVKNLPDGKAVRLSGSVVKDALEKGRELWLVLQDMRKAYDSVG
ncbi:hypothetical protein G9A89_019425 [Geosiphon pyriformis]|nr:hypothetical protein G9A89_019425 [Geosiphon pyriformis]